MPFSSVFCRCSSPTPPVQSAWTGASRLALLPFHRAFEESTTSQQAHLRFSEVSLRARSMLHACRSLLCIRPGRAALSPPQPQPPTSATTRWHALYSRQTRCGVVTACNMSVPDAGSPVGTLMLCAQTSEQAAHRALRAMCACLQTCIEPLQTAASKCNGMLQANAFVHQFEQHGLCKGDIAAAMHRAQETAEAYKSM
jgi:hypothetical protein